MMTIASQPIAAIIVPWRQQSGERALSRRQTRDCHAHMLRIHRKIYNQEEAGVDIESEMTWEKFNAWFP